MAAPLSVDDLLSLVDRIGDGRWHNGDSLAAGMGIGRAALSKRAAHLREWGLDLETRPGLGYRLPRALERLAADRIAAQAADEWLVAVAPVIDSTNRALGESTLSEPQALFAELQTAGRGRRGREWRSPFGANLYASFSWTFPGWPAQITALPLAVGIATAEAILECAGPIGGLRLKWPNDLHIHGRKLGGILIEPRGEATGACRVVIGIGLNLAMSATQATAIDQPWATLEEAAGTAVPRNALAAALIRHLDPLLRAYVQTGFQPWRDRWNALDATRDRAVRLLGDTERHGVARGVDDSGALLLEVGDRLEPVYSGDVSLRLAE